MLADVRAQMAPSVQRAQTQVFAAFGWVPWGFDVERDLLGRFARGVAGLYCVTSTQVLLSENMDRVVTRRTLRHELVHAFQDAHYALGVKTHWDTDRGDYIAAIHSLAEGEATCIDLALDDPRGRGCLDRALVASSESSQSDDGALESLPTVVRRSLIAPYVEGVRYVQRLLQKGGWGAVERAWEGELQSTRQLVHEPTQPVEPLPMAPPPTGLGQCTLQYIDVIGEQGLRAILGDMADASEFAAVLESLVGERVAFWECADRCIAAIHLRFARADAAASFGRWLCASAGIPAEGSAPCNEKAPRMLSFHHGGPDIAIASVLPCHGHVLGTWGDMCPILSRFAVQMADFHPSSAALLKETRRILPL
jgi:hypothetical protein